MKILISELAARKIQHWVDKANFEVSGFGKVEYWQEFETFYVSEAYLVKQEGSAGMTDIDNAALAKLMFKTKDVPGMLNFWWHSHVNMGVFWSGTDEATIKSLGAQGLCVATVFNKRKEMRSAVCAKMTGIFGERTSFWDEIPTTIFTNAPAVPEEWNKEFDDNVVEKKWSAPSYPKGNESIYGSWNKDDWEQTEHGAWVRKKSTSNTDAKTSMEQLALDMDTSPKPKPTFDRIPYWAIREARLIDMTPSDYYERINGEYDDYCKLQERVEIACLQKEGITYDEWIKPYEKERETYIYGTSNPSA